MSDEISVEGIRRIAEADDWKNFPGWKGTRALARLALRLRAEVERLNDLVTGVPQLERTIARLTAERDALREKRDLWASTAAKSTPPAVLQHAKADAKSWRRVAERLEGEKQAAEARSAELERLLREIVAARSLIVIGNADRHPYASARFDLLMVEADAALAAPEPEEPRCPTIPDRGTLYMPCGHRKAVIAGEPLSWDCFACQPEEPITLREYVAEKRKAPEFDAAHQEAVRRLEAPTTRPEPKCEKCEGQGYRMVNMRPMRCACRDLVIDRPEGEGSET